MVMPCRERIPSNTNILLLSAGPWTVFAPTNSAFMNLPMKELEELITNPKKLSKLVLNHLINRLVYLVILFELNCLFKGRCTVLV